MTGITVPYNDPKLIKCDTSFK